MLYFEAPRVATVSASAIDDTLSDEIVDLWGRVNDAGGSVGFLPGAPRGWPWQLGDAMTTARRASLLCVLREPAGPLRGLGLWEHDRGFPFEHVAGLKRLMVDPRTAGPQPRPDPARRHGRHRETGAAARRAAPPRLPRRSRARRVGSTPAPAGPRWAGSPAASSCTETDYRDDVAMARRVDGLPLAPTSGR